MNKTLKLVLTMGVLLLLTLTIILSILIDIDPAVLVGIAAIISSLALLLDKLKKLFHQIDKK